MRSQLCFDILKEFTQISILHFSALVVEVEPDVHDSGIVELVNHFLKIFSKHPLISLLVYEINKHIILNSEL